MNYATAASCDVEVFLYKRQIHSDMDFIKNENNDAKCI